MSQRTESGMKIGSRLRSWSRAMTLLAIPLLAISVARAAEDRVVLSVGRPFLQALELDPIRTVAVLDEGRIKTFETLAREKIKLINGSPAMRKADAVAVYLDMMLAPDHHHVSNSIWIKKPPFRSALVRQIRDLVPPQERQAELSEANLDQIETSGLISAQTLDHPAVREALTLLERDLIRTAKEAQALENARFYADPGTLLSSWRTIPKPGGTEKDAWYSLQALQTRSNGDAPQDDVHGGMGMDQGGGAMPDDDTHAAMRRGGGIPGLSAEISQRLGNDWKTLQRAWKFQDAEAANKSLADMQEAFRLTAPAQYPSAGRLHWETWYQRSYKMTWIWIVYMLSLPFLLMAGVYRIGWARWVGLAVFGLGFALHTFSIALRWYLAGRIPNANMFEAIAASAWLGAVAALVLELIVRRFPLKNFFALAAATYAMLAMMVGFYQPVIMNRAQIDNDITTVAPLLDRTIWLYIHTNMVIASYALIFFGSVTAVVYLLVRGWVWLKPAGAMMTIWSGDGELQARAGGAASLMLRSGGLAGDRSAGLSKSLDAATMIFLELAFLTLLTGTILGAIWADVSWGRPWGWDPKEVFAMNTWLVFLVLVHVRLKVQDKALWTAILAVIGCAVMLFNWLAVNFVIVGLHSYA